MIDNFKRIRELLSWKNKDEFYFIQILQRKKDAKPGTKVNGTNNNSRLVKAYYVKSLEHFNFIKPEIIELCKAFNARAGINLNKRSFEKMALQNLKKVTDQIINKSFDKVYKSYSSVVGSYNNDSDKKWILDIDEPFEKGYFANKIISEITTLQPIGEKLIAIIPSKSGYHIITKPFNLKDFREKYPEIEVHKNNPTNLYIP